MNLTQDNKKQIVSLFESPGLSRFVERLRSRMSQGKPLRGKLQLKNISPEERLALATLLGRKPKARGDSATIDLTKVVEILSHAGLCESLESALNIISGPIENRTAAKEKEELAWEDLWDTAANRLANDPPGLRWLNGLKKTGLLKRRSKRDIAAATSLLNSAMSILLKVPVQALRLSELAATETGNSHALDKGQPLSSLVIRYAREIDCETKWKSAEDRRDAWELLGVVPDELSAPVLVLNLRADDQTFTGRVLNLHADNGEPYRLSVRQLKHMTPSFDPTAVGPDVFVCENPTVVDVAAHRLGKDCKPIICIDGQPKTASRLLLNLLTKIGTTIHYHGDFDWEGLRIANLIVSRHNALSWRYSAQDYLRSVAHEYKLKGKRIEAAWDPELSEEMESTGFIVHEEQVLDLLMSDLEFEAG